MVQIAPHGKGLYQIHSMTLDSTLINETDKISLFDRAVNGINHATRHISFFKGSIPSNVLHGYQRIPGKSREYRTSDVEFTS
jgi:hypothetical protein